MVAIKSIFGKSFSSLAGNKKLIIPTICSIVLPMVLIQLFISLSGADSLINQYADAIYSFDSMKRQGLLSPNNIGSPDYIKELVNYFDRGSRNSEYKKELVESMMQEEHTFKEFLQIFSFRNMVLAGILILIGLIGVIYFSCMIYSACLLAVKNQRTDMKDILKAANHFILKFLALNIVTFSVIFVPALLLAGLVVIIFLSNKILGVIAMVPVIILLAIYMIFMSLRLFYSIPILYIEDKGPLESIRQSFISTKGNLKYVFIIFALFVGMSILLNDIGGDGLYSAYAKFLLSVNFPALLINFVLVVFFVMLWSFGYMLVNLFFFYSYIDFDKNKNGKNK